MKKILLLLIVLSSLLFSAIDERKTDVYFANGIFSRSISPDMECLLSPNN